MKMKKVMMFMAMAVCVASVQAAQIQWGNTGVPITDLAGTSMSLTAATAAGLVVNLVNVSNGNAIIGTATINNMTQYTLSRDEISRINQ